MTSRIRAARHLLLVALGATVACDTTLHWNGLPEGGADARISRACLEATTHSDFEWLSENLLRTSCSQFTSCHRGQRPPGGLNLTATRAYDQLVNVPAVSADGWVRVVPGQPESSYVLVKLGRIDGPLGARGDFMPPNSPPICAQKIDALSRWIAGGALLEEAADAAVADAPLPDAEPGPVDARIAD